MSQDKSKTLDLTEPELKILLDLGARELLRQINHGHADPRLTNIINKITDALAPEAEKHEQEKQPV